MSINLFRYLPEAVIDYLCEFVGYRLHRRYFFELERCPELEEIYETSQRLRIPTHIFEGTLFIRRSYMIEPFTYTCLIVKKLLDGYIRAKVRKLCKK